MKIIIQFQLAQKLMILKNKKAKEVKPFAFFLDLFLNTIYNNIRVIDNSHLLRNGGKKYARYFNLHFASPCRTCCWNNCNVYISLY